MTDEVEASTGGRSAEGPMGDGRFVVEVVAVGTELLLGEIVNTNAAEIGAALAEAGLDAHFQTVVGDNLDRIVEALRIALGRSDAVVVTGGLGPTPDDLTREALAELTGRPLVLDETYAAELRRRFEALGRPMPANNVRQAEAPDGAERIPNPKGTAPGLHLVHEGRHLFAIPGVPAEMRTMLHEHVMPRLRAAAGHEGVIVSRLLRTWGRSESQVAEMLDDLYTASTNPSIAYLASAGEIKVRITAKAADRAAAEALIAPIEAEVRRRLGDTVFGVDDETIEVVLHRLLAARAWTIGTAESATGGLVCARLTSVPGASQVVRGGVVAYATDLKAALLGVPEEVLATHGAVSAETAVAMAEGARARLGVDVAVAVTGSAGPDPQERPVGTMIVAVATPSGSTVRELRLPGDRERVRTYAATAALHLTRRALFREGA